MKDCLTASLGANDKRHRMDRLLSCARYPNDQEKRREHVAQMVAIARYDLTISAEKQKTHKRKVVVLWLPQEDIALRFIPLTPLRVLIKLSISFRQSRVKFEAQAKTRALRTSRARRLRNALGSGTVVGRHKQHKGMRQRNLKLDKWTYLKVIPVPFTENLVSVVVSRTDIITKEKMIEVDLVAKNSAATFDQLIQGLGYHRHYPEHDII